MSSSGVALSAQVTAVAGDVDAQVSRLLRSIATPADAVVDCRPQRQATFGLRRVLGVLRRAHRLGRRRGSVAADFERIVGALDVAGLLEERWRALGTVEGWRARLAAALLQRPARLLVDVPRGAPPEMRRGTWAVLRWACEALGQRVVYRAHGTRDLDDLADQLVTIVDGVAVGPDEPWRLLGRTLRGRLADEFVVENVLPAVVDYLDEDGRWLRVLVAGQEVYAPFVTLSPSQLGRVAVRPESILLLLEPLPGRRLTNSLRGKVASIGDLWGRRRVDVDVGAGLLLRAAVEPDTVRELAIEPGVPVLCAFEPAAVRWIP